MRDLRLFRAGTSAVVSASLVFAVMLAGSGPAVRSDAIFSAVWMGFNGWGLVFNLWAFVRGCEAEAVTLDYPTEGDAPDRAMSPRVTTALLAAFWTTGALLLATATA